MAFSGSVCANPEKFYHKTFGGKRNRGSTVPSSRASCARVLIATLYTNCVEVY